ncbi:hypothetical protein LGH82_22805 [Mesorhizobium sp. PAMC28654]|uniref:hypothetical protein n=1 Tax=Mesorhizobium sp. PAMC28654 TaxID=2880934 RepID=UPI001D0B6C48|nr:hypothetical protein [Mesorhizobium sp. PAMC28654]UDL87972.1 hypothetical protein LGH82_22805 [Mesorhizobium sp. PAMC28654]
MGEIEQPRPWSRLLAKRRHAGNEVIPVDFHAQVLVDADDAGRLGSDFFNGLAPKIHHGLESRFGLGEGFVGLSIRIRMPAGCDNGFLLSERC